MRYYPTLTEQATSRDFIEAFGGYNHNLRIGEGEFYDMKNLTSTNYPILSTRQPRGTHWNTTKNGYTPVGLIDKGGLCTFEVDDYGDSLGNRNTLLRMPGNRVYFLGNTKYDASYKRTLISMGAYIIILPDKKYINVTELPEIEENTGSSVTDKLKRIEARFISIANTEGVHAKYELCKADGTAYKPDTTSDTEPTGVESGHIWLDTSVSPHSLKIYSSANSMWSPVATTYIKISCLGIGEAFDVGDAVRISGVTPEQCESFNFTKDKAASIIQSKGDDYIVIIGMMKDEISASQDTEITLQRIMPDMDFVFENNNRLWGCRYGLNIDGEVINEIYASKLGDFKNWEYFAGTSQDSYVVSLGTDGEFTGAISYLGNPLFFRQSCIHTIYGGYPAQYQLQTTECRGVQNGCHNSLTMIDGTLYYKAPGGVCAYTGSLPVEIGSALGEERRRFYGAYGGAYRHKYYLGMYDALTDGNATWLYVYDTEKGLWHKEDEYNGQEFCYCNSDTIDQLYYLLPVTKADGSTESYNIKTIIGEGDYADTNDIDWFAETGIIGCSSPDKKYISRISLRLSIGVGTRVYVFAEYDSSGTWEQIGAITGISLNTFTFPVRPKRCDHLRLRIEGTGEAKIFSISKTLEQGSDM